MDDDKAKAFNEEMGRLANVRKVDFSGNRELSAVGWRCLLSVVSASVEELGFKGMQLG